MILSLQIIQFNNQSGFFVLILKNLVIFKKIFYQSPLCKPFPHCSATHLKKENDRQNKEGAL